MAATADTSAATVEAARPAAPEVRSSVGGADPWVDGGVAVGARAALGLGGDGITGAGAARHGGATR
jgi:hypothetical protein